MYIKPIVKVIKIDFPILMQTNTISSVINTTDTIGRTPNQLIWGE